MLIHVISSDPDDRDHLAFLMRKAGFVVAAHASLEHFLPSWNEQPADLVLLSWFGMDALENEIHAIRDVSEAALIVLVDSAYDQQISTMLEAGADIVLLRPFGPRTLIAYTHRLLRRSGSIPAFTLPIIDVDTIRLDPSTRTISLKQGETVRMTQLEFRLLYTLMSNRDQVIPIENLIERVWGYEGTGSRELARGLISRLRAKIEEDPRNPQLIHTISGVGYLFQSGHL